MTLRELIGLAIGLGIAWVWRQTRNFNKILRKVDREDSIETLTEGDL